MGKMKGNRLNTAANVGTFVSSRQQLNIQRTLAEQGAIQAQLAAAQLDRMHHEHLSAEYQRLTQWAETEVHAGRRTREDAAAYVARYWFNYMHPAPEPVTRVTYGFGDSLKAALGSVVGLPDGWYPDPDVYGWARFWDGQSWTMETVTIEHARDILRQQAEEAKAQMQVRAQAYQAHAALEATHQPREIWNSNPAISWTPQQSAGPPPAAPRPHIPGPSLIKQPQIPAAATPPPPPAPPAGWYPNGTPGLVGYWNGQAWTGDARPQ